MSQSERKIKMYDARAAMHMLWNQAKSDMNRINELWQNMSEEEAQAKMDDLVKDIECLKHFVQSHKNYRDFFAEGRDEFRERCKRILNEL